MTQPRFWILVVVAALSSACSSATHVTTRAQPAASVTTAGRGDESPALYDGFKQPFGPDTVDMKAGDTSSLSFNSVLPSSLGSPTISVRSRDGALAAYIFTNSSNGTFKVTETGALIAQASLDRYTTIHPPSVSVSTIPYAGGDAIVESNSGYIEVTVLVGKTMVKVFGPTAGFTEDQATRVADALDSARAAR